MTDETPLGTIFDLPAQSFVFEAADVDPETMRILFGIDPARDAATEPVIAMTVRSIDCPVVTPVKRRRLTGKRYRAARRRYHREMRAWERGLLPGIEVERHFPRLLFTGQRPVGGGTVRLGFCPVDAAVDDGGWWNLGKDA